MTAALPDVRGARVTVRTRDGRTLTATEDRPPGGADVPLSPGRRGGQGPGAPGAGAPCGRRRRRPAVVRRAARRRSRCAGWPDPSGPRDDRRGLAGLAGDRRRHVMGRVPAAVRDRVVDLVADCVAVSALGSGRPGAGAPGRAPAGTTPEGSATVVGSTRGWPSSSAAFLNACAVAADQLQDGHRLARGHPASHVVPAVLALAEERDLDGARRALRRPRRLRGRRPHRTCHGRHTRRGARHRDLGSGRRLCRRGSPDRPGRHRPPRSGRSNSPPPPCCSPTPATVFAGRTGSHVFLGASVQLGSSLGTAAVAGLEPEEGALDRQLGAVAARAWDPAPLGAGVAGGWADHEVLGGYVKAHPTCAHLHGVNDAVADLRRPRASGAGTSSRWRSGPRSAPRPSPRSPAGSSRPASACRRPSPSR